MKKLPAWLVLGLISLVAGCALGFTNELTSPVIAEQAAANAVAARQTVLPTADSFEEVALTDASVDNLFKGLAGGELVGYTSQVTVKGYGGDIEVVVGMDTEGVVNAISVGGASFSETAGLGSKVKEPAFYEQFAGMKAPFVLKENIDSVSGASISSGAVVDAVNTAVDYVMSTLG